MLKQENIIELPAIGSPRRPLNSRTEAMSPMTQTTVGTTDEHSLTNDDGTETTSANTTSRTPITMTEILKRIDNGDAKSILMNKELHYFFLKHCVINVITRKKWKENSARNDFHNFITASDEGFAFVVIDNNIERYREMQRNTDPELKEFTQPRYTTVTIKGAANNVGKGWNDKGKIEFQRYTEMVMEKRSEAAWLEKRARAIKKFANKERSNNKKRLYDDIDNDNALAMDKEAKDRWNQFMMNSVSSMNSNVRTVAL